MNVAGGFAMGSAADSDMIGNMRSCILVDAGDDGVAVHTLAI